MASSRSGTSLSASEYFEISDVWMSSVALQAAKDISRNSKDFPVVKDIADVVIRLIRQVDLAKKAENDDKDCRSLVDKTLCKCHVLLDSCQQILALEKRGEIFAFLMNDLNDYFELLEEIEAEIRKRYLNSHPSKSIRESSSHCESRLDGFDCDLISRLQTVYGSSTSILSDYASPKEQANRQTPNIGSWIQGQGGLFHSFDNCVVNDGQFNNVFENLNIFNQGNTSPTITTYAHMLPPKPQYLFEREKELELIVSTLLRREHGKVAILGGEGMGKTTLAISAMHDERVIARYGERRLYVSCENIRSAYLVWPEIANALDIFSQGHTANLPSIVLDELRRQDTVLSLDDFEMLWEPKTSRRKAEVLLSDLASIDSLSLLVTKRGTQLPALGHNMWSKSMLLPLDGLSLRGAEKIINAIANVASGDNYLDNTLAEVEGVPLTITLFARLLQKGNETPESLWKRWKRERTTILGNRLSTLDISIRISIDSIRIFNDPNTIDLLALFSLLPNGFPESEETLDSLERLLPTGINLRQSILTLRQVALVSGANSSLPCRLRISPPIRRYCQTYLTVCPSHRAALIKFYVNFIIANEIFTNSSLHRTISSELNNVSYILQNTYSEISLSQMAMASISLTRWSHYIGFPTTDVLRLATEICVESPGDAADCVQCLGEMYLRRHQLADAEVTLIRAVTLHRQANDILGEAYDLQTLGELYLRRDQLNDAQVVLERALKFHHQEQDILDEAYDLQALGELYLRRDQLEDAKETLNHAVQLHMRACDYFGLSGTLYLLAKLYHKLNELQLAEDACILTIEFSQKARTEHYEDLARSLLLDV